MGCPSLSICPLGTEGWDKQLGQRPTDGTPWDVPSLSVHPLGTEGWDGQLGQRPVIGSNRFTIDLLACIEHSII